ncbi:acetyl-CoA C-acetyltransferase [Arthrobacter caoxuetaonis]|uniref:acetyl-CoA C-acetyltransferase n=1 Tax=Arthrobacter caoxuetaonis TaxID=2886935 RepID=UPI001D149B38|nr:acetyl-CoA C-acetyltransferase [Arthrobacter caoxuetaonis]MCC3280798.1 acetyl-CoA C-acetyltransferase [Arthrobacter caoxuetaonis]
MTTLNDDDAVIVSIARTAIGRARKGGLADVRGDELARQVFASVIGRVPGLSIEDVEDLMLGTAAPDGEQGFNMARVVATLLNYDTLPGTTVNRFCASSIQTTRMAFHAIKAGEGDAFLVGGTESTSHAAPPAGAGNPAFDAPAERTAEAMQSAEPWYDPRADGGVPDAYIQMGHTAEYVARLTGVSRAEQDAFAARSQYLAAEAQASGYLAREIVPVVRADGSIFDRDDSIREGTTVDALAELKPVFSPVGTVTAGNACPLNDGASAALVVSGRYAKAHGLQPLARIVSTGVSGLSPEIMGLGPVESSRRALRRAGLSIADLDLIEINEAFAVQVVASARELGIDIDRQLNTHGGAIAIGHPFGATGTRLIGTLINGLSTGDKTLGMAALCVGGGQGMAIVLERLS